MADLNKYYEDLKKNGTDGTEHNYRTPFENLLNELKPNNYIKIIHEPRRKEGFGAPDFLIEKSGAIIGYIETKHIGGYQVLKKWLKSRKNRELSYQEIEHFIKVCNVIEKTIKLMGKVDEVS